VDELVRNVLHEARGGIDVFVRSTGDDTSPRSPYEASIPFIQGNDCRHGAHHEAQKSTRTTWPGHRARSSGAASAALPAAGELVASGPSVASGAFDTGDAADARAISAASAGSRRGLLASPRSD
jgi:hypothetical protein